LINKVQRRRTLLNESHLENSRKAHGKCKIQDKKNVIVYYVVIDNYLSLGAHKQHKKTYTHERLNTTNKATKYCSSQLRRIRNANYEWRFIDIEVIVSLVAGIHIY